MEQETIETKKRNKLSGNYFNNPKFTNLEKLSNFVTTYLTEKFSLTRSVKFIATKMIKNLQKRDYFIKYDPVNLIINSTNFWNLNKFH